MSEQGAPEIRCPECGRPIMNGSRQQVGMQQGFHYRCVCGFNSRMLAHSTAALQPVPADHSGHVLLQKLDGSYYCYTCARRKRGTKTKVPNNFERRGGTRVVKLKSVILTITLDGDMLNMAPVDYKLISDIRRLLRLYEVNHSAGVLDLGPRKPIIGEK